MYDISVIKYQIRDIIMYSLVESLIGISDYLSQYDSIAVS